MATKLVKGASTGSHSQSTEYRIKYRPEDFIVPGQDSNGNSARVYCRVVPLIERAIDVIMGSRKFPFKSEGDLIRWCVKRGVEELDGMEPMVGSVMAQVDAMMSILRDEELNHTFLTVFDRMVQTIGMHVQAQATGEARRVAYAMREQILKMEEGYWRDRYIRELDTKFGYLLNADGAVMSGFDDREEE